MDHVYIVVVNDGVASTTMQQLPMMGRTAQRIAVWHAAREGKFARAGWQILGLATAFGTSLAAWAVVALAITHIVK